eukprot:15358800-Ditylum_brightwellii.AAC.1
MVVSGIEEKLCVEHSKHASFLSNAVASAYLKARETRQKYTSQILATSRVLTSSEGSISQLKDCIHYLQADNSDQQSCVKEQKKKIDDLSCPSHLRRKKNIGCRGGAKWPPCMIKIIREMYVNGTPPSAISANIQMMNIAETLVAYELDKAASYSHAFFDEITRRQIPFTSFSTGHEDNIVNVSPCIFYKDGTSKMQIEVIVDKGVGGDKIPPPKGPLWQ